jgi:ABC-2 type transport system permease protein
MNFRIIRALFLKDLQDSVKNYQVLLMVATPIVLSLLFSNIFSESKNKTLVPKIGVLGNPGFPLLERFSNDKFGVKLTFFQTREELEAKIIEGEIGFGLILPPSANLKERDGRKPQLGIIYPAEAPESAVERIQAALEREVRHALQLPAPPMPIEIVMSPVGGERKAGHSFGGDLFPMLVLMSMGMIGFLALPLAFVEEKEKRTLYALFLTPVSSGELILGKSLFSFTLILMTVGAMVVLNQCWPGSPGFFLVFTLLGAALCIFVGLIIAMVAHNQASVNALGTTVFMFFQLIPNLSQTSDILKSLSPLVPSTFISRGLKKALFLDLSKVDIHSDLAVVVSLTLAAYLVVFLFLRYRQSDI